MPREIPMQVYELASLEDLIRAVNPVLAMDENNLIFFEHCYDVLKDKENIVRQATLIDLLSYFNDPRKDSNSMNYIAAINDALKIKEYYIIRGLSDIIDMSERILRDATSNINKVREHAFSFGKLSGEIANKYRILEHMAYAIEGYSEIKKSLMVHN